MNLTVVGAFVLVLGTLLIAGVLWLAAGGAWRKEVDLYLAIEDESVAGLNQDAAVKFNGVSVGKVVDIRLDPANPKRVRLLFAITRGTPIKVDTLAVLKTEGLTGIAYVELSGGGRDSAPLRALAPNPYPLIRTKPSLGARLENVLTTVLAKLDRTSGNVDALLNEKNRALLTSALTDIAAVSHTVAARQQALDAGITSAARTLDNAARVTAQLWPVIDRIGRSAQAVETMGNDAALASRDAGATVAAIGSDVKRFTTQTQPELQRLLGELDVLSASLLRLSEQTERSPAGLLFGRSPVPDGPGESAPQRGR